MRQETVKKIEETWSECIPLILKTKLGLSDEKVEFVGNLLSKRYATDKDKYNDIELFPNVTAPKLPSKAQWKSYALKHFAGLTREQMEEKMFEMHPHCSFKCEKNKKEKFKEKRKENTKAEQHGATISSESVNGTQPKKRERETE